MGNNIDLFSFPLQKIFKTRTKKFDPKGIYPDRQLSDVPVGLSVVSRV